MDDILKLIDDFSKTSLMNRAAHYRAANLNRTRHYWLGIPSIVIGTAVGTSIFASLNSNPSDAAKIFVGLISFLSAAMASLQTFFKFAENGEKHRLAGASYGNIRRKLDIMKVEYSSQEHPSREEALKELKEIGDVLGDLAKESPDIPDVAYKQAVKIENERAAKK